MVLEFSTPEPNTGCWLWTGALKENGYGAASWHARPGYAHRMAFEAFTGPIPAGMFVCHRCDVRSCCNPDHLFIGTQFDNMRDAARKGRTAVLDRHPMAKLTSTQVVAIRERIASGRAAIRIAEEFGVSDATIRLIKHNRTWKESKP